MTAGLLALTPADTDMGMIYDSFDVFGRLAQNQPKRVLGSVVLPPDMVHFYGFFVVVGCLRALCNKLGTLNTF